MTTPTRSGYEAAISIVLTIALASSVALICAIIIGPKTPSVAAGAIILALAGPVLLWRLWNRRGLV
jgi:hypothetical protein